MNFVFSHLKMKTGNTIIFQPHTSQNTFLNNSHSGKGLSLQIILKNILLLSSEILRTH